MSLNRHALISPGALVQGGGRKTASASHGGGPLVPGGPAYTPPTIEHSSDGAAYRRVSVAGSEVLLKAGNAAGVNVKRQIPDQQEREYYAQIRTTSGGDVLMVPKPVGRGIMNSEAEWAAITDNARQQRVRVFRECMMEAAALVWQGEQLPNWMVWEEDKEYQPPASFVHGAVPAEDAPQQDAAQQVTPLIKTGEDPGPLGGSAYQPETGVAQAYEHTETTARLQQRIHQLEAQVQQLQTRAAAAFSPRKAVIEVAGFGEVETTIDWYSVTDNVLTIAYDNAKQRNILSPKPAEGHAVAQFILELEEGDQKHIFELVATYQSRVTFPAAGTGGATFQQFMISRHETVQA